MRTICAVSGCKHTHDGPAPWVCKDHWKFADKNLRRRLGQARRRGKDKIADLMVWMAARQAAARQCVKP
jgi:hypothetical protein